MLSAGFTFCSCLVAYSDFLRGCHAISSSFNWTFCHSSVLNINFISHTNTKKARLRYTYIHLHTLQFFILWYFMTAILICDSSVWVLLAWWLVFRPEYSAKMADVVGYPADSLDFRPLMLFSPWYRSRSQSSRVWTLKPQIQRSSERQASFVTKKMNGTLFTAGGNCTMLRLRQRK